MATLRRKKAEPFSVFQRDPGPWPPILLNWMATLAIIMVFGLVMLFSASYTTGYLRFGDSFHYIKSQLLCTVLGLGMMFLFSYFDHRFLRRMVKLGYIVCLILLVLVLFSSPINGCRRWISFGGLTLQASEVAKFEMILLTADIAARTPQVRFGEVPLRKWVHHSIVVELIRPILWLMPVLILLVLEPHMSGILLTTAIVGTILLLGGSGLFLLVFQHSLLVISGGFALGKGDGTGGASGQAVAKAVAVVVPHQLGLAVHKAVYYNQTVLSVVITTERGFL